MNLIAIRIAGLLTNDLNDIEFNTINQKLQEAVGMQQIVKILNKHGLTTIDSKGNIHIIKYQKLKQPIRDSYLRFQDGYGQLLRKLTKLPLDKLDIEKNLGPFTEEPEDV